jgi:hypothetical protein
MKKRTTKAIISMLTAAALLAGCAETPPPAVAQSKHRHVSPAPVEPPAFPPDSFDQARSGGDLAAAIAARQAGDPAAARARAEAALEAWPVELAAWEELETDCRLLADRSCEQYAAFFHAKIAFTAELPVRVATLGFQTIAENPVGTKTEAMVYDDSTIAMARRLWAFSARRDPSRMHSDSPVEESFSEKYPYAPALLVIGVGAGLLSGIKALANQ